MKANVSFWNFFAFVRCSSFYFDLASMLGERRLKRGLFSTQAVFEHAYAEPIPIRSAIRQLVSTVMVKEGT
jgi:hypothetical protein